MNSKTAKMIRKFAMNEDCPEGITRQTFYKELKRSWNKTPRNERARLRDSYLICAVCG